MVTASYGQCAARIRRDHICRIRLPTSDSVSFSKEGLVHTAQDRPGSDLDGLVTFWPNASGQEASRCARTTGPAFWQNATGPPPVSHFQTQLRSSTDIPDHAVQNQAGSDLVLAVSGFGKKDPVRKQASPQESCSPLLANASEPTRTGCGMFAGKRIISDASELAESMNGPTCAPHTLFFNAITV